MANTTNRVDVYTRVIDQIVKAIEQGAGAWEMPWQSPEVWFHYPFNVATGKRYRGVNAISGENPIPDIAQGNVKAMARAWLDGGARNGHLSGNWPLS